MADLLLINALLALVEGAAYAATAIALRQRGGTAIRRRLVFWWVTAAGGLALSAALLFSGRGDPTELWVRLNLAATLALSSVGVILLASFLWFLIRGEDKMWLFTAVLGAIGLIAVLALIVAPAAVVVEAGAVRLAYENGAPPRLYLQGIGSLLVIGMAIWLLAASGKLPDDNRGRARLLAAAVLLFYVGKAMVGATLSSGYAFEILIVARVMGLIAAGLGVAAYPIIPPKSGRKSQA